MITSHPFGFTCNGQAVTEYVLSNTAGTTVCILDYGCILRSILIPTATGPTDIVLGHDTVGDYENESAYTGAFVGRYANRIKNARFVLNGTAYRLTRNDGNNYLHGSCSRKLYRAAIKDNTLVLTAESPAGEDGFPGNMELTVRYTLTEDNRFQMEYHAICDVDTPVNLTNHSYFNLNGSGTVLDQKLQLFSTFYLEHGADSCPTGTILPVAGTPLDFTNGKAIGEGIASAYPPLQAAGNGYDHCYIIDRDEPGTPVLCARAYSPKTGIMLEVSTTEPAVQLYTANFYQDVKTPGKNGQPALQYGGFALETQHFPCSPNFPHFPSTILRAGVPFSSATTLRFSAK